MILVLNCGSQSVKWKLFDLPAQSGKSLKPVKSGAALDELNELRGKVSLIGHRVVHGGEFFSKPIKITDEVLEKLEKLNDLAPLHNPFNIVGVKACQKIFGDVPQFACFDTEFFYNLPEKSRIYALPENIVKKFGFRRYGFHGISHEYVAREAARIVKKPFNSLKIITCHMGGGTSICAIKNGRALDTSMGFTPLEGAVMMTRPGNIDAGIVLKIVEGLGLEKTGAILNKESGIKGICGQEKMLEVLQMLKDGNKKAKLAFDVFVYSVQKYIGAYFAILGRCDLLVFTGAIGFGSAKIRNMICKDLKILNKTLPAGRQAKILAIETDEELAIAQKISKL